jgi:hypothetical protein
VTGVQACANHAKQKPEKMYTVSKFTRIAVDFSAEVVLPVHDSKCCSLPAQLRVPWLFTYSC